MPHRAGALKAFELGDVKHIGNQSHGLVIMDHIVLGNSDPGALLPPVLEGIKSEVGHFSSLRMAVNTEYAAGFLGVVVAGVNAGMGALVAHETLAPV